jgi:GR25 family glycosyltransferase involved in LPS biosynthesis
MNPSQYDLLSCLCLDERWKLWKSIEGEFSKRGAAIDKFIVGKGHILPRSKYDHVDADEIIPTWHPEFTANASHCYVCHRKIMLRALSKGAQTLLLLEDDIELASHFDDVVSKASAQLTNLNIKWDMLYYGAINKWAETEQVSENLLRVKFGGYCWHCTGINQQNRNNIAELLAFPAIAPFDVLCAFLYQPTHQVYSIWPPVAYQKPGYSFVCERELDNMHLFGYKGLSSLSFQDKWYAGK